MDIRTRTMTINKRTPVQTLAWTRHYQFSLSEFRCGEREKGNDEVHMYASTAHGFRTLSV